MPSNNTPPRRSRKTVAEIAVLDREIVKAVIEDTVLTIAADAAAMELSAETDLLIAETPEEEAIFDIAQVPYLGPSRIAALALAGITTIASLNEASVERIAGVKGVGSKNAAYIKNWVARRLSESPEQNAASENDDAPPAPPFTELSETAPEVFAGDASLHRDDSFSLDPATSIANQTAHDDFDMIDGALRELKEKIPKKSREKSLRRQLDKVAVIVSDAPEGRDRLRTEGKQKVARTLDRIAKLLSAASEAEKLSAKKQAAIGVELRDLRKRLEKTLDE